MCPSLQCGVELCCVVLCAVWYVVLVPVLPLLMPAYGAISGARKHPAVPLFPGERLRDPSPLIVIVFTVPFGDLATLWLLLLLPRTLSPLFFSLRQLAFFFWKQFDELSRSEFVFPWDRVVTVVRVRHWLLPCIACQIQRPPAQVFPWRCCETSSDPHSVPVLLDRRSRQFQQLSAQFRLPRPRRERPTPNELETASAPCGLSLVAFSLEALSLAALSLLAFSLVALSLAGLSLAVSLGCAPCCVPSSFALWLGTIGLQLRSTLLGSPQTAGVGPQGSHMKTPKQMFQTEA